MAHETNGVCGDIVAADEGAFLSPTPLASLSPVLAANSDSEAIDFVQGITPAFTYTI